MKEAKKLEFPPDRPTPPEEGYEETAAPTKLLSKGTLKSAWLWRVLAALSTLGILSFYLFTDWRDRKIVIEEKLQEADVLINQALMEIDNDPDKVEVGRQCQPPLAEDRMRLEEARLKIERASNLAPKYARAKNALGVYHLKICERATAKRLFQESVAMDKEFALAYSNLGALHYQDGQFNDALVHFEKASELDHKNPHPLVNIALIWLDRKDFRKASDALSKASEMKPGSSDIRYLLGKAYYLGGHMTEAILHLREAVRLDDYNSSALYYLALACREAGNHLEAIENLQNVLALDPSLQDAYPVLGDSLIKMDRPDEAEEILKVCLEKWPNFRDCSEVGHHNVPLR